MEAKYYIVYCLVDGSVIEDFRPYCDEETIEYIIEGMNLTGTGVFFAVEDGVKVFGVTEEKE